MRMKLLLILSSLLCLTSNALTIDELIRETQESIESCNKDRFEKLYVSDKASATPTDLILSLSHEQINLAEKGWRLKNIVYTPIAQFIMGPPEIVKRILTPYTSPIFIDGDEYSLSTPLIGILSIQQTRTQQGGQPISCGSFLPVGKVSNNHYGISYQEKK